nr:hypothetical protein Iba_chr13bCG5000 [Ipomoea batatas]
MLSYHKQSSECAYFLLPVPIDRSSKLLSASSCPPLLVAALRVKDDALDSCPGCCTLWAEDKWPLLELSLRVRFSVGSVELGLLLDATAFLEELPLMTCALNAHHANQYQNDSFEQTSPKHQKTYLELPASL